jgi:hypothetical protein
MGNCEARGKEEKKNNTSIKTAFVSFLCTTTRKGDMSITGIFINIYAIWFLTTDE